MRWKPGGGEGEQGPVEGGLANAQGDLARYKCADKDGNKLEEKGVAHLSKAKWDVKKAWLSNEVVSQMLLWEETGAAGGWSGLASRD